MAGRVQPSALAGGNFAPGAGPLFTMDFPVGRPGQPAGLLVARVHSSSTGLWSSSSAGAVIGTGAGLVGHAGTLAPDGSYHIDIAAPRVGRGAMMGARSGLSAGAELRARASCCRPARMIKPFTRWDGTAQSTMSPAHRTATMPDLSRTATEANIEPLTIPVCLNIGIGTARRGGCDRVPLARQPCAALERPRRRRLRVLVRQQHDFFSAARMRARLVSPKPSRQ